MKSSVIKRSVDIDGRKTSVSLEDAFWSDLKEIAYMQRATLSKLIMEIDKGTAGQPIFSDTPVRTRPSPRSRELVAIFSLPPD